MDRWLAMVASLQLYHQQNILVIDAGTATTIDLVNSHGQHIGGWIMPGIKTLFESLQLTTQKVNATAIDESPMQLVFGTNTSACVQYGNWAMTIGAINEAINQAKTLLPLKQLIFTGGNGKQLNDYFSQKLTGSCSLNHQQQEKYRCCYKEALIFYGLLCLSS